MKNLLWRYVASMLVLLVVAVITLSVSAPATSDDKSTPVDLQKELTMPYEPMPGEIVVPSEVTPMASSPNFGTTAMTPERAIMEIMQPTEEIEPDVATLRMQYLASKGYKVNGAPVVVVERIAYTEEDVLNVAKIIELEAGSWWLSDHHQLMAGNVLINRWKSPEFPDTLPEIIDQKNAYETPYSSRKFQELEPSDRAMKNARLLLEGIRVCPPCVIFQANFKQGTGTYETIEDDYLPNSYFCYANNMQFYPDPSEFETLRITPTAKWGYFNLKNHVRMKLGGSDSSPFLKVKIVL